MGHGKATCTVKLTVDQKKKVRILAANNEMFLSDILDKSLSMFLERRREGEVKYLALCKQGKNINIQCDETLSEEVREFAINDDVRFVNVFTNALLDFIDKNTEREAS